MSVFNIDEVFWSEPRIVDTKHGPRRTRTWVVPTDSPFWQIWRSKPDRENFKAQGYSLGRWKGDWIITEWRQLDGSQTGRARRATAAARPVEMADSNGNGDQTEQELPPHMQLRFNEIVRIYDAIREETGDDYSYQLPSIKRLAMAVDTYDGALDASDTGVGKTPVACAVARMLGRDLFVVCPKNVIPPWRRMAERFGVRIEIINYEMLRTGNTDYGYWKKGDKGNGHRRRPTFMFEAENPAAWLFVFDECHRMKDYTTLNCAMGVAAIEQGYKVLGLSATAADNPMHMKFVALLTGLIRYPAYFYGWMMQHGVRKGKWGLEFTGGTKVLSKLHHQIFPRHGSRIRVADLGDRFPQTRIISEAYEMNGATEEIQDIYAEMRVEIARLERSERSDKGANILVAMLRARQRVELLKVPTLVQMAQDGLDEGMSVVLIVNFQATVTALARRLKTANTITGEDKADNRQLLIDAFNAQDEKLVIMNIRAGGLGIGLHIPPQILVLISPTFSGIDLKQALGRCHRAGGGRSIQKIVWAAGTIEEKACDKVRARLRRVSIFNDDSLDDALAI